MSGTVTTDIFCDAPRCLAWINGVTGLAADIRRARIEARRHGWHCARPGGRDICPECWTAGER